MKAVGPVVGGTILGVPFAILLFGVEPYDALRFMVGGLTAIGLLLWFNRPSRAAS